MSFAPIEISCPHCLRVYRLRVDLRTLANTRSTARCGRCGRRFSLEKRVHDSGVMTAPLIPAAREVGLRPSRSSDAPEASGTLETGERSDPFRDTHPSGPPLMNRPPQLEAKAERRNAKTAPDPPSPAPEWVALRSTTPSPPPPAPRDSSEAVPHFASEPPHDSEPNLALLRRRRTQPQLPERDAGGRARARDEERRDGFRVPPPEPVRSPTTPASIAARSDPLGQLTHPAPVGGDDEDPLAPLDVAFSEDLTPVPSEAGISEWALDPDAWVARADPGIDALAAAHSEAAEALRWLLFEDRLG